MRFVARRVRSTRACLRDKECMSGRDECGKSGGESLRLFPGTGFRCRLRAGLLVQAAAQRTVEIDGIGQAQQACLYQGLLSGKKLALRV